MHYVSWIVAIAAACLTNVCSAQTLYSYNKYGSTYMKDIESGPTNRYYCPAGVAREWVAGAFRLPNVVITPKVGSYMTSAPAGESMCFDLSKEPGAVSIILQLQQQHTEQLAVLKRQAEATEKLATQMETWMKRAELDLRTSIDAKFKALPTELLNNPVHTAHVEALRASILKEVECRQDPSRCN
jgi:hypothetical protein